MILSYKFGDFNRTAFKPTVKITKKANDEARRQAEIRHELEDAVMAKELGISLAEFRLEVAQ